MKNKVICEYNTRKFLSESTKTLIKQRDVAYKLHRRSPTTSSLQSVRQLKKEVVTAIYRDTRKEFAQKVEQLHLWGALKKLYPAPKLIFVQMKLTPFWRQYQRVVTQLRYLIYPSNRISHGNAR